MSNQQNNLSNANSNRMRYLIATIGVIATIIASLVSACGSKLPVEQALTVRVTNQKGSPVSGASVLLLSNEVPSLNEYTDNNGLAHFSIQSATFTNGRLIIETDEYEIHERAIESLTDARIEVRLDELDPTSSHIILRVIDPQKNALSNTELQLFIENNVYNQVADTNGVAKFTVPFFKEQIEALITAKNEGFEVKDQRITLWLNQVQDILLNPETSEIEVVNPDHDETSGNNESSQQTDAGASDTEQEKEIPSDIPGHPLELGSPITSEIDKDTKPRDVYQVRLKAGEVLEVNLDANKYVTVEIYSPNSRTIGGDSDSLCRSDQCKSTFAAAVEGDYSISVSTQALGVVYTLTTRSKEVIPLPNTADDIPGVPLDFDSPQKSIIDQDTKPRDVYQVRLKAGEVLEVNLDANKYVTVEIYSPNSRTIGGDSDSLCRSDQCKSTFTAEVEGDYHIAVSARALGVVYTLLVNVQE